MWSSSMVGWVVSGVLSSQNARCSSGEPSSQPFGVLTQPERLSVYNAFRISTDAIDALMESPCTASRFGFRCVSAGRDMICVEEVYMVERSECSRVWEATEDRRYDAPVIVAARKVSPLRFGPATQNRGGLIT
jgi:hypothetical protein